MQQVQYNSQDSNFEMSLLTDEVEYWKARAQQAEEKADEVEYWKDIAVQSRKELRTAQDRVDRLIGDVNKAKSELALYKKWIANKNLPMLMPRVLAGIDQAIQKSEKQGEMKIGDTIRVYRNDIAQFAGVSPSTVSDYVTKLADSGIVTRLLPKATDEETGDTKNLSYLSISDQAYAMPSMLSATCKRPGGDRKVPTCRSCHSTAVQKRVSYICTNPQCGVVMSSDEVIMLSEDFLTHESENKERIEEEIKQAVEERVTAEARMEEQKQADDAARMVEELRSEGKPKRACFECWYVERENDWVWDLRIGQYVCSNLALHDASLAVAEG